jgi:multidrug efflux pump subunit AcrA (membrane-fusion protein)
VSGGKAVETRVRSGRREGPDVEILEGLTPGQVVVVEPGNLVGGQSVAAAAPSSPS